MMRPEKALTEEERQRSKHMRIPTEPITPEERNWLLYLKAIEAENWVTSSIYHSRLTEPNQTRPHSNVVWAVTQVIPNQIDAALQNGFIRLAEMRLASARLIASHLPDKHRTHLQELESKITNAKVKAAQEIGEREE